MSFVVFPLAEQFRSPVFGPYTKDEAVNVVTILGEERFQAKELSQLNRRRRGHLDNRIADLSRELEALRNVLEMTEE